MPSTPVWALTHTKTATMANRATIGNSANGSNGEIEKRKEESIPFEELLMTRCMTPRSEKLSSKPKFYPVLKSSLGLWINSYPKFPISEPSLMRPTIFYVPYDRERFF